MAILNLKKRQIECKIVYYGPGRCGKTTNMEYIYKTYTKQVKGEMVSIDTEGDRTLFFDFLPMGFGEIKGYDLRVQVYTVPGQVQYRSTRKLVLKGRCYFCCRFTGGATGKKHVVFKRSSI